MILFYKRVTWVVFGSRVLRGRIRIFEARFWLVAVARENRVWIRIRIIENLFWKEIKGCWKKLLRGFDVVVIAVVGGEGRFFCGVCGN